MSMTHDIFGFLIFSIDRSAGRTAATVFQRLRWDLRFDSAYDGRNIGSGRTYAAEEVG